MKNELLTFNDLPQVVAQLRDEVMGMKAALLNLQNGTTQQKRENTHRPMSVEEAAEYTRLLSWHHVSEAGRGLTTMVSHLTEERNSLLAEIESLKNNRIADGNRYTKQILELQEKLLDVQTRMEHKQQMLAEKQAQLNGMERRVQAAQAKAQQDDDRH